MKVTQLTYGETSLVSYVDKGVEHRCFIPAKKIIEGDVDQKILDAGIPYGAPWSKIIKVPAVTPELVENALHNAGIWTMEDLRTHPQLVQGALQVVFHLDLSALLEAAKPKTEGV